MTISINKQGTKVEMFYLIKLSSDVRIFITPPWTRALRQYLHASFLRIVAKSSGAARLDLELSTLPSRL
jgi:hypothetical protein